MFKENIETKVYHLTNTDDVPYHLHEDQDEVFYCFKGMGVGVLDSEEIQMNVGDTLVAPAGSMHTLKTESDLYVTALLIPADRIICHCKQVSFGDIRRAMASGVRTVDEVVEATGAGTGCGKCLPTIEKILTIACGCKEVTVSTVVDAVKNGADTVEKIAELTGLGTDCGRCKALAENIIELKR